ncbi:unnamed protein product [Strongylus vulgaris]|uniref:Aminopeptidase N-like N-terminal domain-containing protein n=1 Tax=Strongylus vulgaris TaxID=40348 RepID=A0A3P7L1S8_STRVU|nr:unnamed protein product [Strongylus vulgaris]
MVDCIYYLDSIDCLINTLSLCKTAEILCVYEKRDIGEPVIAQKTFFDKIVQFFKINTVPNSDLHPDYSCCDEISVIKLLRKYSEVVLLTTPRMYRDPTTSSNYDQIKVTHYSLDWKVDFVEKRIAGSILMTLKALTTVDKVVLDIHSLEISSIELDGQGLKFDVEAGTPIGEKLIVHLSPLSEGQEIKIEIKYSTAKEAAALQFLDKDLTADKKVNRLQSYVL